MVVAAVLVAMAVKVCVVLLPAVAVELAGDMVTEDNTVVLVKPVMVTAVEISALPAESVTEADGFTVAPEATVGDVPKVTSQTFSLLLQLTAGLLP
jgi:hypothetical protein